MPTMINRLEQHQNSRICAKGKFRRNNYIFKYHQLKSWPAAQAEKPLFLWLPIGLLIF